MTSFGVAKFMGSCQSTFGIKVITIGFHFSMYISLPYVLSFLHNKPIMNSQLISIPSTFAWSHIELKISTKKYTILCLEAMTPTLFPMDFYVSLNKMITIILDLSQIIAS